MNEVTKIIYPRDRKEDQYEALLSQMKTDFHELVQQPSDLYLYKTDITDLFQTFLQNLPADAVQHYTCNCCRRFVNKYGSLVSIDENGDIIPAMWTKTGPGIFVDAVEAVKNRLKNAKVTAVFYTDSATLGVPTTGEWNHMAVQVPRRILYKNYPGIYGNGGEKMSASQNDYKTIWTAIENYSIDVVTKAMQLINSGALFRSDKIANTCATFLNLLNEINGATPKVKRNLVWRYIACVTDPGCLHIKSSVIGTLLDDIKNGVDADAIIKKFNDKMDPMKYQRPQAAPSTGNIERAEKLFEELGLTAKTLKRRFATIEDLQTIWKPVVEEKAEVESDSVFGHLKDKAKDAPKTSKIDVTVDRGTMTWNRFSSEILPHAKSIKMYTAPLPTSCVATFLTSEYPEEKCIFKHGNNVTFYLYKGELPDRLFGIKNEPFIEITAICYDPELWDGKEPDSTSGITLILKDAVDNNIIIHGKRGTAIFSEDLISELREVRSTIAKFSAEDSVLGGDKASATGLRIQRGVNYGNRVKLLVETDTMGILSMHIDRWE